MARKGAQGKRRSRNQQRATYDELDKYPVMPPHAFARIVRDKRTLNIIYQIIEPPLNKKEQEWRDELLNIFIRSLTANIEEIDADPVAYLRTAMDKVIKAYGMKVNKCYTQDVNRCVFDMDNGHWAYGYQVSLA